MTLIKWEDAFEVGIPSVDYEHRKLIALINEGYSELGDDNKAFDISEYLGEIYARISSHFALEEKEMRDARYDAYDSHKEDHEVLLEDIRDMMEIYENQGYFDEGELAAHLKAWFTGHFKDHDALLHGKLGR